MIGVSALGPSQKKADYSNYGLEQISVAAPGGWFRDGFGTDTFRTNANLILSTYPLKVLQEEGTVDADGNIVPEAEGLVFKECTAAGRVRVLHLPAGHLDGVAARRRRRRADREQVRAQRTATPASGSTPDTSRARSSTARPPSTPARVRRCRRTPTRAGRRSSTRSARAPRNFNGFYGYGIVDAYAAVKIPHKQ